MDIFVYSCECASPAVSFLSFSSFAVLSVVIMFMAMVFAGFAVATATIADVLSVCVMNRLFMFCVCVCVCVCVVCASDQCNMFVRTICSKFKGPGYTCKGALAWRRL